MAASISLKSGKVAAKFMQRTAGLLSNVAGEYIKDAMPTTTSTIDDAKAELSSVTKSVQATANAVAQKARSMKRRGGIKRILDWYMQNDDSNDQGFDDLGFDIETDDASDIAEAQIGEAERNANKIASAVFSSNQKLLEGQMELSSDISVTLDNQTAVISAGFDKVNSTLDKILEVLTKNTATLIETTVASAGAEGSFRNGKFDLNTYKNMVSKNIKSNPTLGFALSMLPMMKGGVGAVTPETILSMVIPGLVDKKAPNLKKNMEALDKAVNDAIMQSLIRIGENKSNPLSRIFGIDASRKEHGGSRSSLELKTVPFDSIAHEAITNAIPGYLQKILVQLGGPNLHYDYRSRSFKSMGSIRQELNAVSAGSGALNSASRRMQSAIGNDQYGRMMYDIMMADLGGKQGSGAARNKINTFSDPKAFEAYMTGLLAASGVSLSKSDINRIRLMGKNFAKGSLGGELATHVATNNLDRNQRVSKWMNEAERYNIDTSKLKTSVEADILHLLKEGGMVSNISDARKNSGSGVNYTNKALYEIHRLLDRGINVFQVGSNNSQKEPFTSNGKNYLLAPPDFHRPRQLKNPSRARSNPNGIFGDVPDYANQENLTEDEQLQGGANWGGWLKGKGKALGTAMLHGKPEDVRAVFMQSFAEAGKVAGDALKRGAEKINQSFGNVTGYLKHKLFGTGYSYTDENGETVTVKDNEGGGVFGFVKKQITGAFGNAKKAVGNWFQSVKGYFDYGEPGPDGKKIQVKRNKLIATSVGALAGGGLLGGPLGLLMGGIAGSALSGLDIGSKIHEKLFGKGDEKGKGKGLFTKLTEGVIDPIKYQFQKTAHHIGQALKKNILGPLSDIGVAIRDRVTSAAHSAFSKVFGFLGNLIIKPFKALGNGVIKLFRAPAAAAGGLARGAVSAGTGLIGTGLSGIANFIASGRTHTEIDPETGEVIETSSKRNLRERRKKRNADIKSEGKFKSYKDWKVDENARRAQRIKDLKASVEEEVAENTEDIASDVSTITKLASEQGSLYVHDQGIHDRLDTIIEAITGKRPNGQASTIAPSGDNGTNAAITTAAVIATEGNLTTDDAKEFNAIQAEAEKEKPSKSVIRTKLNKLFKSQEKDKVEEEKKSTSLWDWIKSALSNVGGFLSGILGHLPAIAAAATALWALFGNLELSKLGSNLQTALDKILGRDENSGGGSTGEQGVDAATSIIDVDSKGSPILGWSPFGTLYHNKNDKDGNSITNVAANTAKNALYFNPILGAATKWGRTTTNYLKAQNAVVNSAPTGAMTSTELHASQQSMYDDLFGEGGVADKKIASQEAATNLGKSGTDFLKKAGRTAADLGIAVGVGNVTDWGITKISSAILNKTSLSDEKKEQYSNLAGDVSGRVASLAAVGSIVKEHATGNAGFVGKIRTFLEKAGEWIAKKFTKKFPKASSKVAGLFEKAGTKLASVGSKLGEKIAAAVSKVTGKSVTAQSLGALTLGLLPAILGGVGALNGALYPEHLFAVASGDADGVMRAISSVWNGMMGALSATPVAGIVVALWDIVDMVVAGLGAFDGLTLSQYLCRQLYGLIMGDEALEERTATFDRSLAKYNEDYGTDLDAGTFNDMMNNTGMLDRLWNGKRSVEVIGEDGQKYIVQNDDQYAGLKGKFKWTGQKIGQGATAAWGGIKKGASAAWGGIKTGASWIGNKAAEGWAATKELASIAGGKIKEFATKTGEAAKDVFEDLSSGVGKLWGFVKTGDVSGLWQSSYSGEDREKENDAIGKFASVIYTIGKVITTIPTAVSWAGHKVVGFVKSIPQKIRNSFSSLGNNLANIGNYVSNGDPGGLLSLDFADDPENPVGGFTKGIFTVSKIVNVPIAGVKWIGGKIADFFRSIPEKVKNSFNTLSENHGSIKDLVKAGSVSELTGLQMEEDPENPVGGITKAIFTIDKIMHVPGAALHWVGNKIKGAWDSLISTIKKSKESLDKNVSSIHEKAKDGDLSGLHDLEFEGNDENPLNGVMHGIFGFTRIINYPRALVHWVGNKIKDGFDGIKEGLMADKSSFDSYATTINDYSDDGRIADIWNVNPSWSDKDPLRFIWSAALTITKIWNTLGAIIPWIGNKIKKPIEDAKEWIVDTFSWIPGVGGETTTHTSSSGAVHGGISGKFGSSGANSSGPSSKSSSTHTSGSGATHGGGSHSRGGEGAGGPISNQVFLNDGARSNHGYSGAGSYKNNPVKSENSTTTITNGYTGNPLNKSFSIGTYGHFGERTRPHTGFHKGVDLSPSDGSHQALLGSTVNGEISYVKNTVADTDHAVKDSNGNWHYYGNNSAGNQVTIKSDDGVTVKYMHIKHGTIPSTIKAGTRVSKGTYLGEMGTTGWSTAPHLHYQMEDSSGNAFDPEPYVYGQPMNITGAAYTTTTTTDTNAIDMENKGILGNLISMLTSVGSNFLSKITGGLFNANTTNSTMSSINDVSAATDGYVLSSNTDGTVQSKAKELWQYFRGLGYSEKATAAILGCWFAESGCKPRKIEWDYSNAFKTYGGYDMVNNRQNMDAFTLELFAQYDKQGHVCHKEYYKASQDGHYYPGLGLAQWTGPRGKALLDYCKKNNMPWDTMESQLSYMDYELRNGYSKIRERVENATTLDEATKQFMMGYEGNAENAGNGSYLKNRREYAKNLYNQFKGTAIATNSNNNPSSAYGYGGPTTSTVRQSTYVPKPTKTSSYTSKSAPQYSTPIRSTTPTGSTGSTGYGGPEDTNGVIQLLRRAIDELVKITNNTASSTTYLESINDKDFVDQGLRDSISALGKVKSAQRSNPLPRATATAASNIARP